jgi:hypothetical protein
MNQPGGVNRDASFHIATAAWFPRVVPKQEAAQQRGNSPSTW